MVNDRIGDFIIRLQNAAMVGKREVSAPYSKLLLSIAQKLRSLGYLTAIDIKETEGSAAKTIVISLAYDTRGASRLRGVKRISKPGRRLYTSHTSAHKVKGGTGSLILSSSEGIVTDTEARAHKVGGEELFKIW